jgi:Protein of unknown function (DUF2934)/DDE domain
LQKALQSPGHPRPRVINVDGNPSCPKVIAGLKKTGDLGWRCRCRPVRYLNNIVENGIATFGHDDIAAVAHELWQARGCPDGSPQEDWFHAAEELRSRFYARQLRTIAG